MRRLRDGSRFDPRLTIPLRWSTWIPPSGKPFALTLALCAGLVLLDERRGRQAARELEFQVSDTLAVIGLAAERKLVAGRRTRPGANRLRGTWEDGPVARAGKTIYITQGFGE